MLLRGRPGSFDPSHLLPAAPQLPPFTSFLSDITLPFFSPLSILRKVELRIPVLILYYPEGTHTSSALFSGKAARAARCPRLGADRPTRTEYTSKGCRYLASWKIQWIGGFWPVRSRMKTLKPQVAGCPVVPVQSLFPVSSAAQCQLSPSTFVLSAPSQSIRSNFLVAFVAC